MKSSFAIWLRDVGVISLNNQEIGRSFTPEDQETLGRFAAWAALAVANARLFEASTQRQAQLTSILEINRSIANSEDMPSLLTRIAQEAPRLVGADGASTPAPECSPTEF